MVVSKITRSNLILQRSLDRRAEESKETIAESAKNIENILVYPDNPSRTLQVGSALPKDLIESLINFLRSSVDVFT